MITTKINGMDLLFKVPSDDAKSLNLSESKTTRIRKR